MESKNPSSRVTGHLQDRPWTVSSSIAALVGLHAIVGHLWIHSLSPGRALVAHATPGDASVLFLGGATVAAMVAGLAGVVVVFALSASGERVRTFRLRGGGGLLANWTSAVVVSFLAAALCLLSSFLRLVEARFWGWAFELAVLLLVHGSLRLIWLLRQLSRIVGKQDASAEAEDEAVDVAEVVLPDRDKH